MTTTEAVPHPINVADLHIVVAAIESQGQFVGYTAVTAPLSYDSALAIWESKQRYKFGTNPRGRNKGHVLHFAVRSVADPRFAPLVGRGYADAITRQGYKGTESGSRKAAKAWAKLYGYVGGRGGWIYAPGQREGYRPVCQGWDSLADILRRKGSIAKGSDGRWYVIDRELVN